jgi:hypothetical protein
MKLHLRSGAGTYIDVAQRATRGFTANIYHRIVPGKCVVLSEILEANDQHLAVSLNTLELEEAAGGAKLKFTIQMVSSVGEGIVQGFEFPASDY